MGLCQSLHYEDDDDKILHLRNKQMKKELQEFQRQLRQQRCFSELDLLGKPKVKKELSKEQQAKAMSIVYDA
jgi:hypothetical protein